MQYVKNKQNTKTIIMAFITIVLVSLFFASTIWVFNISTTTYKVEYVRGHNDIITQTYQRGETITFPDNPAKEGYNFMGWSLNEDDDNILTQEIVVEKELTLYAKWEEKQKTLVFGDRTFLINGLSELIVSGNKITLITDGKVEELTAENLIGQNFLGWALYVDGEKLNLEDIDFSQINGEEFILTKEYANKKVMVAFVSDDEIVSSEFSYGEKLTFPDFKKQGYRLIGFKDDSGRYYSRDYLVTDSIELTAVWQVEEYEVIIPRTNGMYVVNLGEEKITSGKVLKKTYNEEVSFSISLSSAYSDSNYDVYANSVGGKIYPSIINNMFYFNNINCDMQIVVDNVKINSYSVNVDGVNYGRFSYGSWLVVNGNQLQIKDIVNGTTTTISTLIEDAKFGGWESEYGVIGNCVIQDISINNNVEIFGNYSKKVSRIKLVANGGQLDTNEIILIEGESVILPIPSKYGYQFAGWYVKLVEVNTIVDNEQSIKFGKATDFLMVLYAGWTI